MNILNLRFELSNPVDCWEYFKNLGCVHGRIGKHWSWEFEHTYYSTLLVDIEMRWSRCTDHAGFDFTFGLFGYGVHFRIYDTRHWDYEKNAYTQTHS